MLERIVNLVTKPERIVHWVKYFCNLYRVRRVIKDGKIYYEFSGDLYPEYLHIGNAMSFIKPKAQQFCQGKGIDVGADQWPFPGAIPVRNEIHQNALKLDSISDDSLDYVFSSHCLEHLHDWKKALVLWITKLKKSGTLFIYLPHISNKMWHPGGVWGGPGHKWSPTLEILIPFFKSHGLEIIDYSTDRDEYWSFYIVCKKV